MPAHVEGASLRPNLSATRSYQNLSNTYSLVFLPLWLNPGSDHVLPVITSSRPFFAHHVMTLVASGTLSCVPINVSGSNSQNMLFFFEPRTAVDSSRLEPSFLVIFAILHCHRKHELGAAQKNREHFWKPQSQNMFVQMPSALDVDL